MNIEDTYYNKNKVTIENKVSNACGGEIHHDLYAVMEERIVGDSELSHFIYMVEYACCRASYAIRLTEEEQEEIKKHLTESHIKGFNIHDDKCPFKVRGECSIYENRPYSCRTYGLVDFDYKTNVRDIFKKICEVGE